MLQLGFSAGLQGVIFSAANVMIQSAVNSFGSAVMAGSSAASGIENFIHTALNAFYQSAITFTGQSMGASNPRQALRVFQINLSLTAGLGIVLCVLTRIFQVPLLGLYVQTTLIGACLLRVIWRYTVFEAVGTVESMYWSYPVSWLLTFLIHLIYLERDRRRLMTEKKEDVRAPVV